MIIALVGVGCALEPSCPPIDAAVTDTVLSIDTPQGHKVTATLYAPVAPGEYPLVVFSHGAFAAPERYDTLLRHWASAGVVVAAPLHIDSELVEKATPPTPQQVWLARQQDVRALALVPTALTAALPSGVTTTANNWIAAGHSYGAFVAQAAAGATSAWEDLPAPNVTPSAIIALSPPGPIPTFIEPDAWATMRGPHMVLTGTADILPGFIDDWRVHAAAYEQAVNGDQWLWVGEGVDHYFGRLMGRLDRETAPQTAGFDAALATTRAFLDSYASPDRPATCRAALAPYRNDVAMLTRKP
ncbi:MAG: hypothetical protein AAGH76_02615 [Pseudomonadota bacterium]